MDVVSLCPLRVASLPWRPSADSWALTVICKALFDLGPGELTLAQRQDDPNEEENFWDDDPNRSLRDPSDLVPFKPQADVVLVGSAFTPKHTPVRSIFARLIAAGVDKTIELCADRTWSPDGSLREGPPFTTMPLRYERAAFGAENPVGARIDPRVGGPLPNLQPPGTVVNRPDVIAPIGFGPIAAGWASRSEKLGRYAAVFASNRWGDEPLLEDFDASYFNMAPPDQQPERIEPGARLALENLHPQHPLLRAKLPDDRPRAFVERNGGLEEIPLTCDTLWIDTDQSICTLTWRGQLGVTGPHDEGRVFFLLEHPSRPLGWPEIQQACAAWRAPMRSQPRFDPTATSNMPLVEATGFYASEPSRPQPGGAALPFVQVPSPPQEAPFQRKDTVPPWLEASASVPRPKSTRAGADPGQTMEMRVSPRWPKEAPAAAPPPPSPSVRPPSPSAFPPALLVEPPPLRVEPPPPPLRIEPPPPRVEPPPPLRIEPPQRVEPVSTALAGGVLAASNHAASVALTAASLDPAPLASPGAAVTHAVAGEIVDLLWFDPTTPDRARLHLPWQELIAKLRPTPIEDEPDDGPPEDPPEVQDRRDVFGVLTEAARTPLEEFDTAREAATSRAGAFTPPLVLLGGELALDFEEQKALEATLAVVAPFATGTDKKLKETFDQVSEALKSPWMQASSRAAESLGARLREAFAQPGRALPAGYLEQGVERILVEQRHYRKRKLLGQTWIRATLTQLGGGGPIPVYLPEALAEKLPLYPRFAARLLAELHLQQDHYEAHPLALRALALARVVPARPAARKDDARRSRAQI